MRLQLNKGFSYLGALTGDKTLVTSTVESYGIQIIKAMNFNFQQLVFQKISIKRNMFFYFK